MIKYIKFELKRFLYKSLRGSLNLKLEQNHRLLFLENASIKLGFIFCLELSSFENI